MEPQQLTGPPAPLAIDPPQANEEKKDDSPWQVRPPAWAIAEDGKLELSDNPLAVVAANDAHRKADVPDGAGSDLWTIDQWKAAAARVYKFEAPTFAPPNWGAARPIGQETYSQRFAQEFPEVAKILPMPNVAVAGGAAAWPLGDPFKKASDIDFFLYGLPSDECSNECREECHHYCKCEESRRLRWGCVSALVTRIREQFVQCVELLSPGLVTIKASRRPGPGAHHSPAVIKLQIILRAYPTVSSILHGFDVPSCSVAYDGWIANMTRLAAFAHTFRANIVVPEYRSTTYESRLLKYFDRGYALVMPHLDLGCLARGVTLMMPNLTLTPTVIRGRFATGTVALATEQPESDYDGLKEHLRYYNFRRFRASTATHGQPYINIRRLAAGQPPMLVGVKSEHQHQRRERRPVSANAVKGLPFDTFWSEPTWASALPRDQLLSVAGKLAAGIVAKCGRINVPVLRAIFGLNPEQIAVLSQRLSETWESTRNTGAQLDATPSLIPFVATLLAKYDALPKTVGWWILSDPARQHTSSINPRCESPSQWYGAAYSGAGVPPSAEESLETIIGVYESRMRARDGAAFDGICALCHDEVHRGDINSVTLPCGHVFHWAAGVCAGLLEWATDVDHQTCPVCRLSFAGAVPEPHAESTRASISIYVYVDL